MYILYPGSWNPLHSGHLEVAHHVEKKYGVAPVFAISRNTYDKGTISEEEINRRAKQFQCIGREYIFSDKVSFVEKSTIRTREESYFITGYDTIKRVDDPKYYFNSIEEKNRCLKIIYLNSWKFLVFPRNGKLKEDLSPEITKLCIFQDDFKEIDISSTEIRNKSKKPVDLMPLAGIGYGRCFIMNGEKYKLLRSECSLYTVIIFNGEEFINISYENILVEPSDIDFYPYMDDWGNKK